MAYLIRQTVIAGSHAPSPVVSIDMPEFNPDYETEGRSLDPASLPRQVIMKTRHKKLNDYFEVLIFDAQNKFKGGYNCVSERFRDLIEGMESAGRNEYFPITVYRRDKTVHEGNFFIANWRSKLVAEEFFDLERSGEWICEGWSPRYNRYFIRPKKTSSIRNAKCMFGQMSSAIIISGKVIFPSVVNIFSHNDLVMKSKNTSSRACA